MKKLLFVLLLYFFSGYNLSRAQDTLTILHLNGIHSTLPSVDPGNESSEDSQGGIARAATVIDMTKMKEPNIITLHAGDVFTGDLFFNKYFGVAEFQHS